MSRIFATVLLTLGATLGLPAQEGRGANAQARSGRIPTTVVRVIGPDKKPAAGARVYISRGPFVGEDRPALNRVSSFACDARGIARLRVTGGTPLCCWAVAKSPTRRLASTVVSKFIPGRPLRLELANFEAFRVRCLNAAEWHKAVPGLKLRFVMHGAFIDGQVTRGSTVDARHLHRSASLEGFVAPSWEVDAPKSRTEVLELPPLPMHSYYAVLCDPRGGFLDTRYMNPQFHNKNANARVQHLYERNKALKQLAFGKPTKHLLSIKGRERGLGKAIALPFAQAFLRPQRQRLQSEFAARADAYGNATLVLPQRFKTAFGFYNSRLLCSAPGYVPQVYSLSNPHDTQRPPATSARNPAFALPTPLLSSGRVLDWRVRGLEEGDQLLLFTMVKGHQRAVPWSIPLNVDENGQLKMPAPTPDVERGGRGQAGRFDLVLVRNGEAIPLWTRRSGRVIPAKLELNAAELCQVSLAVESSVGRPSGGILEIHSDRNNSVVVLRRHIDRRGSDRFWLPKGKWVFALRTPRAGDVLKTVELATESVQVKLGLTPYRLLQGSCSDADGKTVLASIRLRAQLPRGADAALQRLAAHSNLSMASKADGAFALYASAQPGTEFRLTASASIARRSIGAVAYIKSREPKAIQLVLERKSRSSIW